VLRVAAKKAQAGAATSGASLLEKEIEEVRALRRRLASYDA
jgi:hypothetical protein